MDNPHAVAGEVVGVGPVQSPRVSEIHHSEISPEYPVVFPCAPFLGSINGCSPPEESVVNDSSVKEVLLHIFPLEVSGFTPTITHPEPVRVADT